MEQAIRRLSKVYGFSFSIMRVGPLGPAKAGEDGLVLEASDTLTVGGLEPCWANQCVPVGGGQWWRCSCMTLDCHRTGCFGADRLSLT